MLGFIAVILRIAKLETSKVIGLSNTLLNT